MPEGFFFEEAAIVSGKATIDQVASGYSGNIKYNSFVKWTISIVAIAASPRKKKIQKYSGAQDNTAWNNYIVK